MPESNRFDALLLFLITVISAVAGASDSRLDAQAAALHKQILATDGHSESASRNSQER
jgi:hypothetical protein